MFKLEFEIVTCTQTVTSKGSPESNAQSEGVNTGIAKREIKIQPSA
jgi:hypothetical protein